MTATTHADRDALLQAILDDPADDLPRLAFADWLEENGEEADRLRAEFVRVQVRLDRVTAVDFAGGRAHLLRREDPRGAEDLLRRELELWEARDPNGEYVNRVKGPTPGRLHAAGLASYVPQNDAYASETLTMLRWRRGFVCFARCALDAWLGHGPAVARAHPVERVEVTDRGPLRYNVLPGWPPFVWSRPRGLAWLMRSCDLPDDVFGLLVPQQEEDGGGRKHYGSEEAARADLSRALILLARGGRPAAPV